MRKLIVHISLAIVTCSIGVAANAGVNALADPIVDSAEALSNLGRGTFLWREPRLESTFNHCGFFVVTLSDNGEVYLGSQAMGSLPDTSYIRATLEDAFQVRARIGVYKLGLDLSTDTPEDERIEKTVL